MSTNTRTSTGSQSSELFTVCEAAAMKGIASRSLYRAIEERRLPCVRVLGKIGVRQADLQAYEPVAYRGRAGAKPRGGRRRGTSHTPESKARISASQKARWQRIKTASAE